MLHSAECFLGIDKPSVRIYDCIGSLDFWSGENTPIKIAQWSYCLRVRQCSNFRRHTSWRAYFSRWQPSSFFDGFGTCVHSSGLATRILGIPILEGPARPHESIARWRHAGCWRLDYEWNATTELGYEIIPPAVCVNMLCRVGHWTWMGIFPQGLGNITMR